VDSKIWDFAAGHRRGWQHLEVPLSLLYRFGAVLVRPAGGADPI
jgi:hypothetical protein